MKLVFTPVLVLLACLIPFRPIAQSQKTSDCIICERVSLFQQCKAVIAADIWPGLQHKTDRLPLLYFDEHFTHIAFASRSLFEEYDYRILRCANGLKILQTERFDSIPFHMENKMNFNDTASLFYYRPMMMCSDVETIHRYVADFDKTEDWLQLVMHEYFHGFQFSHPASIRYLADSIGISADTLNKFYKKETWFKQSLQKENAWLLHAIQCTNKDSLQFDISEYIRLREERFRSFASNSKFPLRKIENFWETMEGTARYAEYFMAGHFSSMPIEGIQHCDTLFKQFADYPANTNFEDRPTFKERTQLMEAYYYVTGFNICRLLDKLKISYKKYLFDHPDKGLYPLLLEKIKE